MFSDMLFTAVCPLKDLQRFVVFKIISIVCTVLSFDYGKRIADVFEDFIKIFLYLKKDAIRVVVVGIAGNVYNWLSWAIFNSDRPIPTIFLHKCILYPILKRLQKAHRTAYHAILWAFPNHFSFSSDWPKSNQRKFSTL
jgi:hypothetical protein